MTKKYLYIIPLFFLETVIQLGFFWLAPECECRWMAYAFLTVMTIVHLIITFVVFSEYGIRKGAATVVAGSLIQVLVISATAWLLAVRATERSALFLMLMLMALYAAVVTILWISIEGFSENHIGTPDIEDDEPENGDDFYRENGCRESSEDVARQVNVPLVRERSFTPAYVNRPAGRDISRRTPPPIPVKH